MTARVLVLSSILPWPTNTGGRIRTARLVDALASEYDVTVVGFGYPPEEYESPPAGVRLVPVVYQQPRLLHALESDDPDTREAAAARLSHPAHEPWLASYYDVPAMRSMLRELGSSWQAVLVEGTHMARFLPDLPRRGVVLDLMDVCAGIYERRAAASAAPADRLEAERVCRFEAAAAVACQAVLTVSVNEQERAWRLLGCQTTVIPNGVDVDFINAPGAEHQCHGPCLLFVGSMSYRPNVDAALWIRDDLLPVIRATVPTAHVHVVGRMPPPELVAARSDGFLVHGEVPDIRPFYRSCDVVVVPVLTGGGSRLKVIEAAAAGKAIVSTPLGAEGFGAVDGRHLVLATSAAAFAAQVVALLAEPERASSLGDAARELGALFDWSHLGSDLRALVADL